jgi:hypothetical protein
MKRFPTHLFLALLALYFVPEAAAQSNPITMELLLSPDVENAQTLSPSSLGIDMKGKGNKVVVIILKNETSETVGDLYFYMKFEAKKFGRSIIEVVQSAGKPFSLKPFQLIVTDNNQIQNGLPGIEEAINLETSVDNSQQFITSLNGSTTLPDDIYTFTAEIRRGGNTPDKTIARVVRVLGAKPTVLTVDLFLLQPGGPIDQDNKIASTMPLFRWDGPVSKEYRVIVVRDNDQPAQTLMQQALSTNAALNRGRQTGNALLEFEIVDALVQGTSFNMEPNGTQKLLPGNKYYWQVFTVVQSGNGTSLLPSAMWSFEVQDLQGSASEDLSKDMFLKLRSIVKADKLQELQKGKFTLEKMVIDGKTVTGVQSISIELDAFLQKIQEKSITVNN